MKAKLFITVLCLSAIFFLNAQIKVTSTGKVGIGTTNPSISNNVTVEGDSVLFRAKSNTEHGFLLQRCSFDQVVDFSPIAHNSNNWEYDLGMEFPFDWFHSIYEYIENSYIDYGSVNTLDVYNFYNYSDKRLKKNIKTMSFDKDLFSKLNPVSFDISDSLLITDKELKAGKKPSTTHQYGFLAQELQTLYPQLVSTDKKTAYLKVKPLELLPILVSAIQDLQAKTDAQAKQIAELINNPTSEPKKVSANPNPGIIETNALTYPVLDQNTPNPFNQSTYNHRILLAHYNYQCNYLRVRYEWRSTKKLYNFRTWKEKYYHKWFGI